MADTAKTIAIQDLAQSVTEGVLRAVSAQSDLRAFLGKGGPGLVIHPIITAGGWIFFGDAGRFAAVQGLSAQRIEG